MDMTQLHSILLKIPSSILLLSGLVSGQEAVDTLSLDWNTSWEEIEELPITVIYDVENITHAAGVRGAEAEDEILEHLYYRQSMKGLAKLDLQKILGKLIIRREKMSDEDSEAKKIDGYIVKLKYKLNSL